MGLYHPKLEPGERIVWRRPEPPSRLALVLGVGLAVLSWVGIYMFVLWISPEDNRLVGVAISLWLPLFLLGRVSSRHIWQVAVTDRRLLVQAPVPFRKPWETPLDEIESVSMNIASYRIQVRAGGREAKINPDLVDLPELKQAVKHAAEGAA